MKGWNWYFVGIKKLVMLRGGVTCHRRSLGRDVNDASHMGVIVPGTKSPWRVGWVKWAELGAGFAMKLESRNAVELIVGVGDLNELVYMVFWIAMSFGRLD